MHVRQCAGSNKLEFLNFLTEPQLACHLCCIVATSFFCLGEPIERLFSATSELCLRCSACVACNCACGKASLVGEGRRPPSLGEANIFAALVARDDACSHGHPVPFAGHAPPRILQVPTVCLYGSKLVCLKGRGNCQESCDYLCLFICSYLFSNTADSATVQAREGYSKCVNRRHSFSQYTWKA